MSTESGTSATAPDPTVGSSVAPRYSPVGYGGYTGVSEGAPFTGVSTPHFEDISPASTSVLIVGAELISSAFPIGLAAHTGIMIGGLLFDIYETVEGDD